MAPDIENDGAFAEHDSLPPKARLRRPRLVVVIGLWMLCLPNVILSAYVAADILFNFRIRSNLYIFWLAVGVLLLTASILYRITKNYLTRSALGKESSADYAE